jgi:hypothetical protein
VLGYLDALMALPAAAAIAAAASSAPATAGALLAIACLTKAQALFVAPVVALAVWNSGGAQRGRRLAVAFAAVVLVSAVVLTPYLRVGASRNVIQGVGSLLRHDMLSADAANLWWLVTYVMRASYAAGELGAWAAWTLTLRILGISTIVRLGYPNPRPIATLSIVAAAAWTLWRARRSADLALMYAAAALIVHAYFILGVAVHENHLYLAVPLLAGAAAFRPRLRPVFLGVSAVFALNLYLFFGFGRGLPLPPRNFTVIDSTVIVAAANCVLFAWHARVFSAESRAATNQSAARENRYPYDRASPAGSG